MPDERQHLCHLHWAPFCVARSRGHSLTAGASQRTPTISPSSSRMLGGILRPSLMTSSVTSKILRRTGEIVNAVGALGARTVQYRVCCDSLSLYRAQCCASGGALQATQRLLRAAVDGFLVGTLAGPAVARLLRTGVEMRSLADAARLHGGASRSSHPSRTPKKPCSTTPSGFESATRCWSPRMLSGLMRWVAPGWEQRFPVLGSRPSSRRSCSRGCISLLPRVPRSEQEIGDCLPGCGEARGDSGRSMCSARQCAVWRADIFAWRSHQFEAAE